MISQNCKVCVGIVEAVIKICADLSVLRVILMWGDHNVQIIIGVGFFKVQFLSFHGSIEKIIRL